MVAGLNEIKGIWERRLPAKLAMDETEGILTFDLQYWLLILKYISFDFSDGCDVMLIFVDEDRREGAVELQLTVTSEAGNISDIPHMIG